MKQLAAIILLLLHLCAALCVCADACEADSGFSPIDAGAEASVVGHGPSRGHELRANDDAERRQRHDAAEHSPLCHCLCHAPALTSATPHPALPSLSPLVLSEVGILFSQRLFRIERPPRLV